MTACSSITALLIDPIRAQARRVTLTIREDSLVLAELYDLLRCNLVERAPFDDAHLIWADENGWDEATGLTVIDGGRNAIAGRFLIVAEDEDGTAGDVAADVTALLDRLVCHRCLFEAEFMTRTGGDNQSFAVETRLHGVTPRIDRRPPQLTTQDD